MLDAEQPPNPLGSILFQYHLNPPVLQHPEQGHPNTPVDSMATVLTRHSAGQAVKLGRVGVELAHRVFASVLVLQRRVMRKHAQVFFFSYGPFIMGDSHSFVASFKIRPRVTL